MEQKNIRCRSYTPSSAVPSVAQLELPHLSALPGRQRHDRHTRCPSNRKRIGRFSIENRPFFNRESSFYRGNPPSSLQLHKQVGISIAIRNTDVPRRATVERRRPYLSLRINLAKETESNKQSRSVGV